MNKKELIQKYPEIAKEIFLDSRKESANIYDLEITDEEEWQNYFKQNKVQPILTTEDGKELYEGDKAFKITKNIYNHPFEIKEIFIFHKNDFQGDLIFYTYSAAEKYIIENSRQLSFKDVCNIVIESRGNIDADLSNPLKIIIKQRLGI